MRYLFLLEESKTVSAPPTNSAEEPNFLVMIECLYCNVVLRKDTAMSSTQMSVSPALMESETISKLRRQYGCGPVEFAGTNNALYERHLTFDSVVDLAAAGAHERFEALARSIRDVLSQRW